MEYFLGSESPSRTSAYLKELALDRNPCIQDSYPGLTPLIPDSSPSPRVFFSPNRGTVVRFDLAESMNTIPVSRASLESSIQTL